MSARTPEDVDSLFFDAMNRGDLGAAVALHEADARWHQETGVTTTGHNAIRGALQGILELAPRFTAEVATMTNGGEDVALMRVKWSMRGTGADGQPVSVSAVSMEIVRRQADGTWRFAVIAPGSE